MSPRRADGEGAVGEERVGTLGRRAADGARHGSHRDAPRRRPPRRCGGSHRGAGSRRPRRRRSGRRGGGCAPGTATSPWAPRPATPTRWRRTPRPAPTAVRAAAGRGRPARRRRRRWATRPCRTRPRARPRRSPARGPTRRSHRHPTGRRPAVRPRRCRSGSVHASPTSATVGPCWRAEGSPRQKRIAGACGSPSRRAGHDARPGMSTRMPRSVCRAQRRATSPTDPPSAPRRRAQTSEGRPPASRRRSVAGPTEGADASATA